MGVAAVIAAVIVGIVAGPRAGFAVAGLSLFVGLMVPTFAFEVADEREFSEHLPYSSYASSEATRHNAGS
jgi:hypothetical protein